jgi:flavin reductase (DIM6/NTAB) family NADH-FMN oxidoreductase RutF
MHPDLIAAIFAHLDRELWIVTARAGERRSGLIATFVSQASIAPEMPRVVIGLGHRHFTTGLIKASGAFALHLIGDDQLDWVWRFGLQHGDAVDKLAGLNVTPSASGSPVLVDAQCSLECRVEDAFDIGDRALILAEVVHGRIHRAGTPLTMKRLLELAPAEQLRALKDDLLRDATGDADAITAWRSSRQGPCSAAK